MAHLDDGVDVQQSDGVMSESHLQVIVALLTRLEANPTPQLRVDNLHSDAKHLLRNGRIDLLVQALRSKDGDERT
jgi:hypothetical protein